MHRTFIAMAAIVPLTIAALGGAAVAQETTPEEAVELTGRISGSAWREVSDPRLEGRVRLSYREVRPGGGFRVWHEAFRIDTDEGAWQERPAYNLTFPEHVAARRVGVLDGEGAYEGLLVVAEFWYDRSAGIWDVRGVIYEGDLPPEPTALTAP
jgi:hypothetical protein